MTTPRPPAVPPEPGGLVLAPFRALRYDPDVVGAELGRLASPPYDVIDPAQRAELAAADPRNVVRLILPRDPDGEPGGRYRAAAALLERWRAEGVLRADSEPALYVYEEAAGGHVQRGLVGALGLTRPDAGVVLPHENTMAGPVADRLALTEATAANLEPIFLVYPGGGAASDAVAGVDARPPLLRAHTPDGVDHRVWALTDRDQLAAVTADLRDRRAVIADGHHRYATYLAYQEQRWAAGDGGGPWDRGLALLVDATRFGPLVEPIHRVLPALLPRAAVEHARAGFAVRELADAPAGSDGAAAALAALASAGRGGPAFLLAGDGAWHLLTEPDPGRLAAAVPPGRSAAWRGLDVTIAHHLLVRDLWGLPDREDVVDYRHDVAAALAAAEASGGTALLLNPTPVPAVVGVAEAGERMPRKSTLFLPKPATGLLMRRLADG